MSGIEFTANGDLDALTPETLAKLATQRILGGVTGVVDRVSIRENPPRVAVKDEPSGDSVWIECPQSVVPDAGSASASTAF